MRNIGPRKATIEKLNTRIQHNKKEQRFYALRPGNEAYAKYKRLDDKTMVIVRTYVPRNLRRQGLGSKLVKRALDYAIRHQLKVVPECDFTKYFLEKNEKYKLLLNRS